MCKLLNTKQINKKSFLIYYIIKGKFIDTLVMFGEIKLTTPYFQQMTLPPKISK